MGADALFQEVKALFEEIAASFGGGDLARYRRTIALPCIVVSPLGAQPLRDQAEFDALFVPMMQRLKDQGFARSAFERLSVKRLAPNMALAAMHWTRYRADGGVLETLGATYTLVQRDGEWKLAVLMVHAPDQVPTLA